ncbi:MAG: DUF5702 domain-containing protein [Acetivibrionales bacterium]|jgi:hypothetical protein
MGGKKEKGQISVFLLIILLSAVLLAGVLVDTSRIASADAQVRRAVGNAARSVLAEYVTRLKDEYGVFAYNKNSPELNYLMKSNIERNLIAEKADSPADSIYLDLFGFRVEEVKVFPLYNLTENEVVREQILEYMKYRAPKEMIENVWDKLFAVKGIDRVSESYRKKITVDKLLGKMGGFQEQLKKTIDGTIGNREFEEFAVNGFNKNGARETVVEKLSKLPGEYQSLMEELEELEDKLERLESRLRRAEDEEAKASLRGSIKRVKKSIQSVNSRISQVKEDFKSLKSELRFNQTEAFLNSCIKAVNYIESIIEAGVEAKSSIRSLEDYLTANSTDMGQLSDEFISAMKDDISLGKNLILDGEKARAMIDEMESNAECIRKLLKNIHEFEKEAPSVDKCTLTESEITRLLNSGISDYNNNIEYAYISFAGEENASDPRGKMAENARNSIKPKKGEDVDIEASGISMEDLPSRNKKPSESFDEEDTEYEEPYGDRENEFSYGDNNVSEYNGKLDRLHKEIDFLNNNAAFTDNAFGFLSVLGGKLEKGLIELRDELYINEYIIGTFKNSVQTLKDGNEELKDMDFRGIEKEKRDTFFESEVEYILHGHSSENMNKMLVQGQILLTRFGMNTLHVYTDGKKKALAEGVAAAVAGWWTAGAGIPIISNLIMCGWGMGEAVIDLEDLMDGKLVPFYKTKADWRLDIGLPGEKAEKSNKNLLFSYHDYLRLLLLLKSSDQKLSRIEDLIQLNLQKTRKGFKMSECSTYARIEVTVSMKYFFATSMFIPDDKKTAEGRHKFRVLIYEGY